MGNSEIKTFVKDARLKNALSSIVKEGIDYNKISIFLKDKISLIDFDPEHLRLAPPQHDLSKMLLFSVKDRKKILEVYIETYNSDVKVYNAQYPKYGIKQGIRDKKEFEFIFLNSIIDHALFCMIDKLPSNFYEYQMENTTYAAIDKQSSEFYKYQIENAVYAIDELKHNWKSKYTKKDLKNLDYIKSFLLKGV